MLFENYKYLKLRNISYYFETVLFVLPLLSIKSYFHYRHRIFTSLKPDALKPVPQPPIAHQGDLSPTPNCSASAN